jgi:hypothetical protein
VTAFDTLASSGGLKFRMPEPSPTLVATRDKISRLVDRWDDRIADDIAAENLFMDTSKERRRTEIERVGGSLGACTLPTSFEWVQNALRGGWTMSCERGKILMVATLAPTTPPTVQSLRVMPAPADGSRPPDACQ